MVVWRVLVLGADVGVGLGPRSGAVTDGRTTEGPRYVPCRPEGAGGVPGTRATTARARVSAVSTPASDTYLPRHALGGPACRLPWIIQNTGSHVKRVSGD